MATAILTRDDLRVISTDWPKLHEKLQSRITANSDGNRLVTSQWGVEYDAVAHNWWLSYQLQVAPGVEFLQVCISDERAGAWTPERRWSVASICEFARGSGVRAVQGTVIDSKWTTEDVGRQYIAYLYGYVARGTEIIQFGPFEKSFVHPGRSFPETQRDSLKQH